MLATATTAALVGIDALPVRLEVDLARRGMPAFTLVGLAEGAVREAKERVFSALKNCGYQIPPARITVNLAPADIRKEGSAYDLPLALALLAAAGVVEPGSLDGLYLAGELSLTGEVRPVPGILPLAIMARDAKAGALLVPEANAAEAAVVEGVDVYGIARLEQAVQLALSGNGNGRGSLLGAGDGDHGPGLSPTRTDTAALFAAHGHHHLDFAEVKGQEHAKRAIEIAAAGGHNILLMGPPGAGKTMLASRIPTVLPPLSFEEALEVTKVYSVAGRLDPDTALVVTRPFRSPHHTISDAGLIGGGQYPKPGEVSLAHRGVLFLDELPEFKKHVLEVLRQPLEDGHVTISRAAMSLDYPADFMLVAAMNPCPCGFLTDDRHPCTCTPIQVGRYRSRVSGPLMDRIDLHVEVPAVDYKDFRDEKGGEDSAAMRSRILAARQLQAARYKGLPLLTNADLSGAQLTRFCHLDEAGHSFLERAVSALGLSARATTRVLRIARTIADLEAAEALTTAHLAEAVNYRTLDRESH